MTVSFSLSELIGVYNVGVHILTPVSLVFSPLKPRWKGLWVLIRCISVSLSNSLLLSLCVHMHICVSVCVCVLLRMSLIDFSSMQVTGWFLSVFLLDLVGGRGYFSTTFKPRLWCHDYFVTVKTPFVLDLLPVLPLLRLVMHSASDFFFFSLNILCNDQDPFCAFCWMFFGQR